MDTIVEIDKAGRIVVPKKLRDALRVRAGDRFAIGEKEDGILLQPLYNEVRLMERDGVWVLAGGPLRSDPVEMLEEERERRMRYVAGEIEEP